MKKVIKIVSLLIIVIYVISITTNCFALVENYSGSDISGKAKTQIKNTVGAVLSAVRYAGIGIAMIILLVIASKYLLASAGERADIKKYAVNYIIGAIVLFSASGIIGIISDVTSKAIVVS